MKVSNELTQDRLAWGASAHNVVNLIGETDSNTGNYKGPVNIYGPIPTGGWQHRIT